MLSPKEMIKEIEFGALTKCQAMSLKYSDDCDSKDNQKRDIDKHRSKSVAAIKTIEYTERNPNPKKRITKNNFFKPYKTMIKFPRLPNVKTSLPDDTKENKLIFKKSSSQKLLINCQNYEETTKNNSDNTFLSIGNNNTSNTNKLSELYKSASSKSIIDNYYINEKTKGVDLATNNSFFNKKFFFCRIKNSNVKVKCSDQINGTRKKKIIFHFEKESMKTLLLSTNPKEITVTIKK